jgi:hypothetical protein
MSNDNAPGAIKYDIPSLEGLASFFDDWTGSVSTVQKYLQHVIQPGGLKAAQTLSAAYGIQKNELANVVGTLIQSGGQLRDAIRKVIDEARSSDAQNTITAQSIKNDLAGIASPTDPGIITSSSSLPSVGTQAPPTFNPQAASTPTSSTPDSSAPDSSASAPSGTAPSGGSASGPDPSTSAKNTGTTSGRYSQR